MKESQLTTENFVEGTRRLPVCNQIHVEEHSLPEWDEDAWVLATAERYEAISGNQGCYYLNPMFTVYAADFSKVFSRRARRCQGAWYRRVDQVLLRRHRRSRERASPFLIRQLAYTGILVIDGKPVAPHDWPDLTAKQVTSKK